MKFLILFIFITGCMGTGSWDLDMNEYEIRYVVSGTADNADITLSNYDEGTEQYYEVPLPYEYSFYKTSYDPCKFVSISAQVDGSVIVSIYVNDELMETATATGEYCIASASGAIDSLMCY